MPGPLQAAGAVPDQSEYAPLTMDRYITGLYTQRSPLRDAAVPYLYGKFYSASRFDSLIDGLNREVTAKLTLARRPGLSVWNAQNFPAIRSYYSFKFIQDGVQQVHVMVDTATAVYDATPPNKTLIFTKSPGAGPTRFLGIGTELFMSNGVDMTKWVQSSKGWKANTAYSVGDFITDSNGNLQYILPNSQAVANIQSVQVVQAQRGHVGPFYYILILTFTQPNAPMWTTGTTITFAGLSTFTQLNGQTITYQPVDPSFNLHLAANQSAFFYTPPVYPTPPATGPQPDTGTVTGGSTDAGTSGATQPSPWNATLGGITPDGSIAWTNGGPQVQTWSTLGPQAAPTILANGTERYWQANLTIPNYYSIVDSNGNLEVAVGGTTGGAQPIWNKVFGGYTADGNIGGVLWVNCGNMGNWAPGITLPQYAAIIDSNQNIQVYFNGVGGTTGTGAPAWKPNLGDTTNDNTVVWTNSGPGVGLAYGSVSYCYAWEAIDGTVTTASPLATIPNGMLGPAGGYSITLQGLTPPDSQYTKIDIFRTVQGGSVPLLLTKIPNPTPGVVSTWTFVDTLPDSALNPFIIAPIVNANDPAPKGATAPAYHLQRVWMIVNNQVIWSGGPNTLVGNGNTAFPPGNNLQFPELLTRLIPLTTTQGPALIVIGTANSYAILGDGTAGTVFVPVDYMPTVGALNYDAVAVVGSTPYVFTNHNKFIAQDPGAGYIEPGFPIGDQLETMTTAGITGPIFDAAKTYVTWYEQRSGDTAMYISDGSTGWFRYSPIAAPESGFLFSPFAVIEGGTSAVQSVETATGQFNLLVGPQTSGPILVRDTSVHTDNEVPYPSYATIGNVVLCESGEVAEIAHAQLDSIRVGDRPTVGFLFGEINETPNVSFDELDYTSEDPPLLPDSETLYSDRYVCLQNGECPKCTHLQMRITWPVQDDPDELLSHTIYGAKYSERKEGAAA